VSKAQTTRSIRKAQRELLVPLIENAGFTINKRTWEREKNNEVHFIEIDAAKYGGGFFISGAWGTKGSFGDFAPSVAATDFDNRVSVTRQIDLWKLNGSPYLYRMKMFEYQYMGGDHEACRALVSEAVPGVKALLQWFESKDLLKELAPISDKLDSAPNPDLSRKIAAGRAKLGLYLVLHNAHLFFICSQHENNRTSRCTAWTRRGFCQGSHPLWPRKPGNRWRLA